MHNWHSTQLSFSTLPSAEFYIKITIQIIKAPAFSPLKSDLQDFKFIFMIDNKRVNG